MPDNRMKSPPQEEGFLSKLAGAAGRTGSFGGSGEGPDLYKLALGKSQDELANQSRQMYSDTPVGSQHHRLAGNVGSKKLLFLPTQALGVGVEAAEALMGGMKNPHWKEDTINDLKANWQGGMEGMAEQAEPLLSLVDKLRALRARFGRK